MAEDTPGGGGGFTSDMGRKIGPLPMWAWLGGSIVVGAVALLWMQNRRKGDSTATEPDTPNNFYIPGRSQDEIDEGRYQALLAMIRDLQGKPSTPPNGDPDPDPDPDPGTGAPLLPAPTGFRVIQAWRESLMLGWNKVEGNNGYVINEISANRYPTDMRLPKDAWQHQIQQKLVPDGSYHFTIAALNADNKPGATAYLVAHTLK